MDNIKKSVLYKTSVSILAIYFSCLNVFSQTNDSPNFKPLINVKLNKGQPQDLTNQAQDDNEVDVSRKTYSGSVSKNFSEIDSLITQGKLDDAQKLCESKLKANPNDLKARVMMGNVYSAQYKLGAAHAEYLKVLKKDPYNAEAHNGLGLTLYRRTGSSDMDVRRNMDRYYEEALKEFQTAIRLSPDFYSAYNNAGKILQETGRYDEAENYYRKALEIESRYSGAIDNLGTVLYTKNQIDAAIDKFRQAIELNSKNSSAYYHLGEALVAKGDYSKAIKTLQTALYLNPNSAPVHDMLGKAYQKQGNEAAAIVEYKKSSFIKPEYCYPYLRLSNIYQDRGDYDLAISELKSAVSINPDFLEGKLKIADISLKTGNTEQAIKYYREVMGNPTYTQPALKGLAKSYYLKAQEVSASANLISESEYVDAENAIKQALEFDPDDMQLYLALLRISRLTNKDAQSEQYLSKIISSPVSRPMDYVVKGEAQIAHSKFNEAQSNFRQALGMTTNVDTILFLGEIFITNRQYPIAKEAFNKALSMQPGNTKAVRALERIQRNEELAIAKMNLARGFYNEGQRLAAIEAYKDAIGLNPYLAEAQLYLAKSFEKEKYYYNAITNYTAYVNLQSASGEDVDKYKHKIVYLTEKVKKIEQKGKTIKKFTRI